MLGFKRFDHAAVTISGIELVQKIQNHQFKTGQLGRRSATMPELWNAVLAAYLKCHKSEGAPRRLQTLHQSHSRAKTSTWRPLVPSNKSCSSTP